MIQFVADGSGQQFCSLYFDGLHIHIQCYRFHIIGSGYDAELTGYAKTPFLSGLLSTALYDAGVDQNIRILSGGIDHHDSLQDTYLWCRQPYAIGIVHSLQHILDQFFGPGCHLLDLFAGLGQYFIPIFTNVSDCHSSLPPITRLPGQNQIVYSSVWTATV